MDFGDGHIIWVNIMKYVGIHSKPNVHIYDHISFAGQLLGSLPARLSTMI